MEEKPAPSLFANDGSFMERFKQLQQEKGAAIVKPEKGSVPDTSTPKPVTSKTSFELKANGSRKFTPATSSGKLAFSLKQKSKLVAPPIKLSEDDEEEEKDAGNSSDGGLAKRQKLGKPDVLEQPSNLQPKKHTDMAPPSPSDSTVKMVADKLASFVAKNGRQFEDITKQKNPGDSPFRFLFDKSCADYKYYEYQLGKEEKALSEVADTQTRRTGGSQRSYHERPNYQTPASALYDYNEDSRASTTSNQAKSGGRSAHGESSGPAGTDPIAMMEYYMKKAAQEEKKRQPRHSKDEMPPPASLQGAGKKGHHMGDYIPQEELEQFLASCNDAAAQKAAKEAAERARIKADNVGHKLLSKMGWKEGEGLGSSRSGIADPIMAGNVKVNHLGVGAHQPGEVTPDDDIYEQYKKRMMLGYKHRPNPLGNPRKSYY